MLCTCMDQAGRATGRCGRRQSKMLVEEERREVVVCKLV